MFDLQKCVNAAEVLVKLGEYSIVSCPSFTVFQLVALVNKNSNQFQQSPLNSEKNLYSIENAFKDTWFIDVTKVSLF